MTNQSHLTTRECGLLSAATRFGERLSLEETNSLMRVYMTGLQWREIGAARDAIADHCKVVRSATYHWFDSRGITRSSAPVTLRTFGKGGNQ